MTWGGNKKFEVGKCCRRGNDQKQSRAAGEGWSETGEKRFLGGKKGGRLEKANKSRSGNYPFLPFSWGTRG